MNPQKATERANKAATRYASKQHRFRAETIAHTELAFAYNQGADMGIRYAIGEGLMGRCKMVWTTAGTNRVCSRCMALKDTVVGYTDEQGVQLPPLHPRCRCAIDYREDEKPKPNKPLTSPQSTGNVGGKPRDALPAPQIQEPLPTVKPNITPLPNGTGACENFAALKLYWLNHYGVRFDEAIADLHFESVRAALSGVEAVINEFLPAGKLLNEFGLYSSNSANLMVTVRGKGIINFNPKYFADENKLAAAIKAGVDAQFYVKNMSIVSAGAHEMAHIVEDWLIAKYGDELSTRATARKLIREAYKRAIQTKGGKDKSIYQLKREISIYATDIKISECLAEAIADCIANNLEAALLSGEIWKLIKEELI